MNHGAEKSPPDSEATLRRLFKHYAGMAAYRSGLYKAFFQDKAVVVLFHSVNDRVSKDPLSCSTEKFSAFCQFFRRYFQVVGLRDLLRKLEKSEDITGHLVITFDDGYKDNCDVAAVELKRQRLPGCFFVTTGFVASHHVPWWNQEHPIPPTWMTWDDVRSLVNQGFELGAHTVNHVNLGVITGQEAISEIVDSKEQLARETRMSVELFSYPYGGVDQMTRQNRDIVRSAGYKCCLSAYGGAVGPATDPFSIKRVAVSQWHISPYHFGFEAMLLSS